MALMIERLLSYYEKGMITRYELFMRASEENLGAGLPEALQEDFQEWVRTHPKGECRTFSIIA